jgi:hypothetical protein
MARSGMFQQILQQSTQAGSNSPDAFDFTTDTDASAYDKLAVDQTSSDASDGYISVGSSSDTAALRFDVLGFPTEDIKLLGDALATSDFYLV